MMRASIASLLPALLLNLGCMGRVDGRSVLDSLPDDAMRARLEALYSTPECQRRFEQNDAECWSSERDGEVTVETGISRSLLGYPLNPYVVQTHLKVRFEGREVFYFADAGEGGLEQPQGYGVADGAVNVFCRTSNAVLLLDSFDNSELDQLRADAVVRCVHEAVLLARPQFADAVTRCMSSLLPDATDAPALVAAERS
ncbi:MAG: hypothetical protein ACOX6T_03225 [Myxococcales bacterium]|jgi:hypothetical protein